MSQAETQNETPANRIIIFDTTLRDGEQCPGASMTPDQKKDIAVLLEGMGVDVIEAGFAGSSQKDRESIYQICESTNKAVICSLARCVAGDIEASAAALKPAIDQGRGRIHVFCATSDIHMEHKLQKTRSEVLQMIYRGVSIARKATSDVEFSAEDATRSDPAFLAEAIKVAITAGARTINLPDTVGYTDPMEYQEFIADIIGRVKAPAEIIFSAHCHNDRGLATANSLAAIKGGAGQVEVCVNGLGERAGNAALEEVVMAMKSRLDRYPHQTGIITERIAEVSRVVSEYSGFIVQKNKAIVGENAFAHASGVHQDGMSKNRATYEIMTAASVGQIGRMPITSHSGWKAVETVLTACGVGVEGLNKGRVMELIKKHAGRRKVVSDKRVMQLAVAFVNRQNRFDGRAA